MRDLHRNHDREERESQRAKNEVERLTNLVSGGESKSSGASDRNKQRQQEVGSAASQQRPVPLEDRKRQMVQLAELGVAIPEEYRRDMALAGDWQTVSERVIEGESNAEKDQEPLNIGVRKKRKMEGDDRDDELGDEAGTNDLVFSAKTPRNNNWGSSTRHYPEVAEVEDLDALLASTKNFRQKTGTEEDQPNEGEVMTTNIEDSLSTGIETTEEIKPSEVSSSIIFKKRKTKIIKK